MPRKRPPDPLKSGNIPGQNPDTPERMPGHTHFYDSSPEEEAPAPEDEEDDELDEALSQTFPASDPVSMESTLLSRRRKKAKTEKQD